ncbi:MAG: hypothetical protein KDA65_16000 [Planctomycetaceae bacterium]|nr:hypothetical protein [Planctomycetaceae bacterium]
MSIRFSCQKCDRFIKVNDEKIGRKVICSSCGYTNKVPQHDDVVLDKLGVRTRQNAGAQGKNASPEDMMQELVQTYRTRDIGKDRQDGYQFSLIAMFRQYLLPTLLILLFILALYFAYTWSTNKLNS